MVRGEFEYVVECVSFRYLAFGEGCFDLVDNKDLDRLRLFDTASLFAAIYRQRHEMPCHATKESCMYSRSNGLHGLVAEYPCVGVRMRVVETVLRRLGVSECEKVPDGRSFRSSTIVSCTSAILPFKESLDVIRRMVVF